MTENPEADPDPGQCCAKCGAGFVCGMQAGLAACWCAQLPPVAPPLGSAVGCLCPNCLEAEIRRIQAGTTR
ncbi:MAG: cysteine-rich CWC family protein [Sterolibacteriaceae bacterium]|nr:cysteine-rich CWC family protein [Sterolibacteriaceae bacterium]MBK9083770.1 cysteine-rich CWC family protein [Sterolibacteriaceae bacterium]